MHSNREYIKIDVTRLHLLSARKHKLLIEFLNNFPDAYISDENYLYKDNQKNIIFEFMYSMVAKTNKPDSINKKFYVRSNLTLGSGAFASVNEGLGTLEVREDRLVLNVTMHTDFIYVGSACVWSLNDVVNTCQSKTAYILIGNSLFYVDRVTYRPTAAIDYVRDLSVIEAKALVARHEFNVESVGIQCKFNLNENELAIFSNYHIWRTKKNFILKHQKHTLTHTLESAKREVFLASKTPHLGHVKGPFFVSASNESFMKSEKKHGCTLAQIIENDITKMKKLSCHDRIQITKNLMDAVQMQIHDAGIIHRDLKPENILVDEMNNVYIIDLGLSKIAKSIQREGAGSPMYLSPEACLYQFTDEKSDSYSLWKLIGEFWGLYATQLDNLPNKKNMTKIFLDRVANQDARFTIKYSVDDSDEILSELNRILRKMCKCDRDERYDLAQGRKLFCEINKVKSVLSNTKYIVNNKSKQKLLDVMSHHENSLFCIHPAYFKISETWHVHAIRFTPLYFATLNNLYSSVTSSIQEGVDINQRNYLDTIPLCQIAENLPGNALCSNLVSLFYQDKAQTYPTTALHAAACFNEKMVILLLGAKANPLILSGGLSALDMAYAVNLSVYKILYENLSDTEKLIEDSRHCLIRIIEMTLDSPFLEVSEFIYLIQKALKDPSSILNGVSPSVFDDLNRLCQEKLTNRRQITLFSSLRKENIVVKISKTLQPYISMSNKQGVHLFNQCFR